MPGIGSMQINFTSDIGGLLKGIADSTKALGAIDKAGQKVAENTSKITATMGKAWSVVKIAMASVVAGLTIHQLNEAAETVDKLGKASARLGVGVEQLSALRFAAQEADVDFDALSKMIGKAAKTMAELGKTQDTIFVGNVQVNLKTANGQIRSMTDLLPELAIGLESAGSQAEQLNLASKIFGKQGGEGFVQLLKESGGFISNIGTQTERARRLGVLFTDDQVERLTAYNDAVGRISEAWLGLRVNIMTKVAPILTTWANNLASAIAAIPDVIAKIVDVMKGMWSDPKIRNQFVDFTDALGNIWWTWNVNMQAVAVTAVSELFGRILPRVVTPIAKSFATDLAAEMMKAVGDSLFTINETMGFTPFLTRWIDAIAATLKSVGVANKFSDAGAEIRQAVWEELSGDTWTAAAASDLIQSMNDAIGKAASKGDALFNISAILRSHSMDLGTLWKDAAPPTKELTDFQQRVVNFAQEGKQAIEGFSKSWSDAVTDMLFDGKANFADLAKSWAKTLTSMALNTLIFAPIFKTLGAGFASGLNVPDAGASLPAANAASGAVLKSGKIQNFGSGGIATRPSMFPMAGGGWGKYGEAGPELATFLPLKNVNGKLGLNADGAGGAVVQIIDQRSGGAPVQVRETTQPDGRKLIQAIVRDEVAKMATDGSYEQKVGGRFGLRRIPTAR